ncbi:MAG: para-aminobenzoate synthetase component 1 [Planctomycetota bacterium]|jgi:para-aminobenzoate synthetase component 1
MAARVVPLELLPLTGPATVLRALGAFGGRSGLALLDSAAGEPRRWSVLGFDPLAGAGPLPRDLGGLEEYCGQLQAAAGDSVPGPFAGGFIGALSYDLGVAGEEQSLPADAWQTPPVVGGLYTDFCVLDQEHGQAWLALGDTPGDGRASVDQRERELLECWQAAQERDAGECVPAGSLVRHTSSADHQARVEALRAAIGRGDCYQANLAHRFTRALEGAPLDLYQHLRQINPAPYMAYLAWDEEAQPAGAAPVGALLSASPELLLECQGGRLRTRPIKGTAARAATPEADRLAAEGLLASAKDRAELAMIVDLERNDLGRVSEHGSVSVHGFPSLRTYATVHHLEADVRGRLAPGRSVFDALAAVFPGGSITGAPKLAAMDQIARLEGQGRGFFTGSAGFVDVRGEALWNILIRTLVWRPGQVSYHVGGGITYSSEALAEDEETLHKGRALARALEGSQREVAHPAE